MADVTKLLNLIKCKDEEKRQQIIDLLKKAPEELLQKNLLTKIEAGEELDIASVVTPGVGFKYCQSAATQSCYQGYRLQYVATEEYTADLRRTTDRQRKKAKTERQCPINGRPCSINNVCSTCRFKEQREDNPYITFSKDIDLYGQSGKPTENSALARMKAEALIGRLKEQKHGERLVAGYKLTMEGYDQKEIAEKLQKSESTICRDAELIRQVKIQIDDEWYDGDPRMVPLLDALEQLDESQRKVIQLAFYKGKEVKAIAKKLKMSLEDVEEKLTEALVKLKDYMEQ